MTHFSHPDEQLFAQYVAAVLPFCLEKFFPLLAKDGNTGPSIRAEAAETAAKIAGTMLFEHRKRYPLPMVEEQPWKFPVDRVRIMDTGTPCQSFAVPAIGQFTGLFQQSLGINMPEWVKRIVNSRTLFTAQKWQAYEHIKTMLEGRKINADAETLINAFDWETAPGGAEFWGYISDSIYPDKEDFSTDQTEILAYKKPDLLRLIDEHNQIMRDYFDGKNKTTAALSAASDYKTRIRLTALNLGETVVFYDGDEYDYAKIYD